MFGAWQFDRKGWKGTGRQNEDACRTKDSGKKQHRKACVRCVVGTVTGYMDCVQAMKLNRYSTWISVATSVLTLVVVILLYGRRTNAAFKMPWIILILAFPVLGLGMYLLFGRKEATRLVRERFERIDQSLDGLLIQDKAVRIKLQQTDRMAANEAAYIWNYAKYPIYQNTDVVFIKKRRRGLKLRSRR